MLIRINKLTHHSVWFRAAKSTSCHKRPRLCASKPMKFSFNYKGKARDFRSRGRCLPPVPTLTGDSGEPPVCRPIAETSLGS